MHTHSPYFAQDQKFVIVNSHTYMWVICRLIRIFVYDFYFYHNITIINKYRYLGKVHISWKAPPFSVWRFSLWTELSVINTVLKTIQFMNASLQTTSHTRRIAHIPGNIDSTYFYEQVELWLVWYNNCFDFIMQVQCTLYT